MWSDISAIAAISALRKLPLDGFALVKTAFFAASIHIFLEACSQGGVSPDLNGRDHTHALLFHTRKVTK